MNSQIIDTISVPFQSSKDRPVSCMIETYCAILRCREKVRSSGKRQVRYRPYTMMSAILQAKIETNPDAVEGFLIPSSSANPRP
jgi:hypothetical protein